MKKLWKWRWITFIVLSIIDVIGVILAYFFVQDLIFFIISIIAIQGIMPLLYKIIIVNRLKEIEEKEKKQKEKEENDRYVSIKRIIEILENYEDVKYNRLGEIESTQELRDNFPELQKIGFSFYGDQHNNIRDRNFEVAFGNHTFLIRKLRNRMRVKPYEEYFSKEYSQSETDQSDGQVLYDFITYLKEIIRIKKKSLRDKTSLKVIELQELINFLRITPKPPTIFTDIILLFHKNEKLLNFLHSNRFITSDSVQMENNIWDFFTICRFEKSMIKIKKANSNEIYLYRENEDEKNVEIRDEFIDYILSK